MATYYSINTYIGDGATVQFAVSFTLDFLSRLHVIAYVEDELDGVGDQIYRTINWINDGLVQLSPAPADTKQVFIRRITPNDVLQHDYNDGASIIETNLDESNLQNIMLAQEAADVNTADLSEQDLFDVNNILVEAAASADAAAASAVEADETVDAIYKYRADPSEVDQGVTGNGLTIKALVDLIGSTNESIYLQVGTFTLTTSETIPSNITLVVSTGAIIDGAGVLTVASRIDAGTYQIFGSSLTVVCSYLRAAWFGLLINNTATANATAAALVVNSINVGDTLVLPDGVISIDDELALPAGVNIDTENGGLCTLDAAGESGTFAGGGVLSFTGPAPSALPDLDTNLSEGDNELSFDAAHGLAFNDVFLIYNPTDYSYSHLRDVYRAGEYLTVAEVVDTTTVRVIYGVHADYLFADIDLYKITRTPMELKNVKAIAPGSTDDLINAIKMSMVTDVKAHNIIAMGSDNASLSLIHNYDCLYTDVIAEQTTVGPGYTTQYGMVVGNSQNLTVSGKFKGYRQGTAVGGGSTYSVPNRRVIISGELKQVHSGTDHVANWHGNTEYCEYRDLTTWGNGGISLSGNHNKVTNWTGFVSGGHAIYAGEPTGLDHTYENVTLFVSGNSTGRGVIDMGGNSSPVTVDTEAGGTLRFKNIQVFAPNVTGTGFYIRNRGFIGDWGIEISDLTMNMAIATAAAVQISTVSGSEPSFIRYGGSINVDIPSGTVFNSVNASVSVSGLHLAGNVNADLTAAVSFVEVVVTFDRVFPKAPVVITNAGESSDGSKRLITNAQSITTTGFTARIQTPDTTNFSQTITRTIRWSASLEEI